MKAAATPRWALSLADLALLLLGFFILLHVSAAEKSRVTDSIQAAFAPDAPRTSSHFDTSAERLFEPGEARLTAAAQRQLRAIGANAAAKSGSIAIASIGKDPATNRFDGWELAAARVAAVARAIEEGGLSEQHIAVSMPTTGSEREPGDHRISVRIRG